MPVRDAYTRLYPAQHEIADKLLLLLRKNGGPKAEMRSEETYEPLAERFNLSEEVRNLPRCEYYTDDVHHEPVWHNLVQWARKELKDAGYLALSPRGIWRLSERGIKRADEVLWWLERKIAS